MRGETNKQRRLSLVSKETREHLIVTGNRIDSRKKGTHRLLLKACRQVSHHSLAPLSPVPVSLCLLLLRSTTRFHDANPLSYSHQQRSAAAGEGNRATDLLPILAPISLSLSLSLSHPFFTRLSSEGEESESVAAEKGIDCQRFSLVEVQIEKEGRI